MEVKINRTKRKIQFQSDNEYKNSELYPNKAEQVNGFYFVKIICE